MDWSKGEKPKPSEMAVLSLRRKEAVRREQARRELP